MKILYLVHQFYPETFTGTEKVVLNLAKMMRSFGHKVKVITYSFYPDSAYDQRLKQIIFKEFFYEGIPILAFKHQTIPEDLNLALENEALAEIAVSLIEREKPDIVHVGHPMRTIELISALPQLNIPYLVTLTDCFIICPKFNLLTSQQTLCQGPEHGAACQQFCPELAPEFISYRLKGADAFLTQARFVTASSNFTANLIRKEFPHLNITPVNHGLPLGALPGKAKYYNENSDLVMCYLGSHNHYKGLHTLIEAFMQLRADGVRLKIYGSGTDINYINHVQALAQTDQRIEFCGIYPEGTLDEVLAGVDLVIVPSLWYEAYCLVMREALASQVPVIASNIGVMAETIEDGKNGFLFPPGDSGYLSQILQHIIENPTILNDLRLHIQRMVMPTVAQEAYTYARIYDKILSPRQQLHNVQSMAVTVKDSDAGQANTGGPSGQSSPPQVLHHVTQPSPQVSEIEVAETAHIHLYIDTPTNGSQIEGEFELSGWAFGVESPIERVEAQLDDLETSTIPFGFPRFDISDHFKRPDAAYCGFKSHITLDGMTSSWARLRVRAYDTIGNSTSQEISVQISALPSHNAPSNLAVDSLSGPGRSKFEQVVADYQRFTKRMPSILDWHTNLNLQSRFPDYNIFSPSTDIDAITLPYFDKSIDLVICASDMPDLLAEAVRVAQGAVIVASPEWRLLKAETWPTAPTVSIIIPVHNHFQHTINCLERLKNTLPLDFAGEIIIVDDGSDDNTADRLEKMKDWKLLLKILQNSQNVGFVRCCNRAAETATGEFLVFLNNDTLPQPNWLEPLLQLFHEFPDAGAVGGKLLYPDGRLQEAGGVVFSDGSTMNFGRGYINPDDPLFNYIRDVDYCSGALLVTKRSLFLDAGGFDQLYAPAYYEDVDYCFKLRQRGYRVYYQPESCIIHLEGATSGMDLSSGPRRFQRINQTKFAEKWGGILSEQPPPPAEFKLDTWHRLAVRTYGNGGRLDEG